MSSLRKLAHLSPGEYRATICWDERIGDTTIARIAELAPIKVTTTKVIIYHDDEGEQTSTLSRNTNKSASVFVNMTLEEMAREQVSNYVVNSTKCCWGQNNFLKTASCETHTQSWFDAEVKQRLEIARSLTSLPDREGIEKASLKKIQERIGSELAGNGEWRKNRHTKKWNVFIANRAVGDVVPIRRRDGTISKAKLLSQSGSDLYEVEVLDLAEAS